MHSRVVCECAVQHHAHVNLSIFLYLLPFLHFLLFLSTCPSPQHLPIYPSSLHLSHVLVCSQNVTQHGLLTRCGCGWICGYTGGHWGGQWNRARLWAEQPLLLLIVEQSRVAIVTIATKATLFPFFIDNTVSHGTLTKQQICWY